MIGCRGRGHQQDAYSVVVVETRRPGPESIARAHTMPTVFAERSVTVVSRLARGLQAQGTRR